VDGRAKPGHDELSAAPPLTPKFATLSAFSWMNPRRGSTTAPDYFTHTETEVPPPSRVKAWHSIFDIGVSAAANSVRPCNAAR
jgi:hypothetical protein